MSIPYVCDAGALLAIDGNDRRMWAIHHLAVDEGRRLLIPSVVVGQAWRETRRQVQFGRFLHGCEVVPVGLELAKAAGVLCGKSGTRDVVDASVVIVALAYGAIVFTGDPEDIAHLSAASDVTPGLVIRCL